MLIHTENCYAFKLMVHLQCSYAFILNILGDYLMDHLTHQNDRKYEKTKHFSILVKFSKLNLAK